MPPGCEHRPGPQEGHADIGVVGEHLGLVVAPQERIAEVIGDQGGGIVTVPIRGPHDRAGKMLQRRGADAGHGEDLPFAFGNRWCGCV